MMDKCENDCIFFYFIYFFFGIKLDIVTFISIFILIFVRYLFFITATVENSVSHKYEVKNGIKIRKNLPSFIEIPNLINSILPKIVIKILSQDKSIKLSNRIKFREENELSGY